MEDQLWSNLITVGILVAIFVLVYCRVTGKTLTDFFKEIIGMFNINKPGG